MPQSNAADSFKLGGERLKIRTWWIKDNSPEVGKSCIFQKDAYVFKFKITNGEKIWKCLGMLYVHFKEEPLISSIRTET